HGLRGGIRISRADSHLAQPAAPRPHRQTGDALAGGAVPDVGEDLAARGLPARAADRALAGVVVPRAGDGGALAAGGVRLRPHLGSAARVRSPLRLLRLAASRDPLPDELRLRALPDRAAGARLLLVRDARAVCDGDRVRAGVFCCRTRAGSGWY